MDTDGDLGMSLTIEQKKQTVRAWVKENFVDPKAVANQHGGDIFAAVAAIDDLIETQKIAFNNALPEPFKSIATPKQKASLFANVMLARVI